MGGFDKRDPDVWRKKSGGGCLMLFGLPFLFIGLALLMGYIEPDNNPPEYMPPLVGLVFALVGAVLVFGRRGITIDRRAMKLTRWTRAILLLRSKEYSLNRYGRVTLTKELRQGKDSSYYVWPIGMEGEGGVETITIDEPRSTEDGRTGAEELSRFLGLPLHDSSGGIENVRSPDALDESLREKVHRTGEEVEFPDQPAVMKSTITPSADGTEIAIPAPPLNPLSFLALGLPLCFTAVIYHFILKDFIKEWPPKETPELIFTVFIAFFFVFVPFVSTLIGILAGTKKSARVTVSGAMLRVEERGLLGSTTTEIPSDELEELVYTESTGKMAARRAAMGLPSIGTPITARSDKATLSFGHGLTDEELRYIHALIKKRVTE